MQVIETVKSFFRRPSPSVLPSGGRSSRDKNDQLNLGGMADFFGQIKPYFPIELHDLMTLLSVVNPDVSQMIKNMRAMVNTGHRLIIDAPNQERLGGYLNQKAQEFFKRSGGLDGGTNQIITQICTGGALSAEAVLDDRFRSVLNIVLVPTRTVRFRKKDGDYKPFQVLQGMDPTPQELNEYTFFYFGLMLLDDSPYPIPPFSAALLPIQLQTDFISNIQKMVKKWGLLGIELIKVKKLRPRPGESIIQTEKRFQEFLEEVADRAAANFSTKGVIAHPDGQEYKHHSIVTNANGVKEIHQLNEELLFSGLGTMASLMGRPYSSTETFATVVYEILLSQAASFQRLIKRFYESVYMLDTVLAGYKFQKIKVQWDPPKELNPNTAALADRYNLKNLLDKVKFGLIDKDKAAQEAGYDTWADPSRIPPAAGSTTDQLTLRFNRSKGEYEVERPLLASLANKDGGGIEIAEAQEKKLKENTIKYLKDLMPYYESLRADVPEFALGFLNENAGEISEKPEVLLDAVIEYINSRPEYQGVQKDTWFKERTEFHVENIYRYYKTEDTLVFGDYKPDVTFRFGEGDIKAARFLAKLDRFFFSKFLETAGFGAAMKEYTIDFIAKGEGAFGDWTDKAKQDFVSKFGSAFNGDLDRQFARIIKSTVTRIRSCSHFQQMDDAGVVEAEIVEIMDGACTSGVCPEMNGKRIPIKPVIKHLNGLLNADSEEAALEWIKKTNIAKKEAAQKGVNALLKEGRGFQPFHPECRGTMRAIIEV